MNQPVSVALALLGLMAGSALAHTAAAPMRPDVARGQLSASPLSARDSNITAANTRGPQAPMLPDPGLEAAAPVHDYLVAARDAVMQGKTGKAQEALEMAQTRALSRSVVVDQAAVPSDSPLVLQISAALHTLGRGDRAGAVQIIDSALKP